MGFINRPVTKSVSPISKYLEWKSNDKCFSFYDKENKTNVLVNLPLEFIVLEEYHTVKGFSDSDQTGIYANEVLQISAEEMEVKTFKGRVIAKGVYNEIKQTVNGAGGTYHKSMYIVTKDGELLNLSFKGAVVGKWSKFTEKGQFKRLKSEWVSIKTVENHKKGMVSYSTPDFEFSKKITQKEIDGIMPKVTEFTEYMANYFDNGSASKIEVKEDEDVDDLAF